MLLRPRLVNVLIGLVWSTLALFILVVAGTVLPLALGGH